MDKVVDRHGITLVQVGPYCVGSRIKARQIISTHSRLCSGKIVLAHALTHTHTLTHTLTYNLHLNPYPNLYLNPFPKPYRNIYPKLYLNPYPKPYPSLYLNHTPTQGCPKQLHHWAKIFVSILKRAAKLIIK